MRREITAPGVAEPISHYCDAVEANGFLFVSGCPALDGTGISSGATTRSRSASRCCGTSARS